MRTNSKRQNFNTTPEQEAELSDLREALAAPSLKDAILRAVRVVALLAHEQRKGQALYMRGADGQFTRLLIPELEGAPQRTWTFLVARPHEWRRQLYIKGRRVLASTVWTDLRANGMTIQEAAENWDLPVAAVEEAIRYCEGHLPVLHMEAEEEQHRIGLERDPGHDSTAVAG